MCKRCDVLCAVIVVVSDLFDSLVSHACMLHKATHETAVHARTYLINLDKLKSKKIFVGALFEITMLLLALKQFNSAPSEVYIGMWFLDRLFSETKNTLFAPNWELLKVTSHPFR